MNQPWLKFYPADWRQDPALRMCSLAARGLWIEILCLMWQAEPRGSLRINGRQVTAKQLAPLVGTSQKEAEALVAELEETGVFSRDNDGTMFSRRMRKDVAKAEQDKANGKGGGNPNLMRGKTQGLTGGVNPPAGKDEQGDNPEKQDSRVGARGIATQKPEARSQKLDSAAAAADDPPDPRARLEAECRGLVGQEPVLLAQDFHALAALLDDGLTEDDIRTGIAEGIAKADPTYRFRSWRDFAKWARTAGKNRLAGKPRPNGSAAPPNNPDDPRIRFPGGIEWPSSAVRAAVERWERDPSTWPGNTLGFPPGDPSCRVPQHLLPERLRQPEEIRH